MLHSTGRSPSATISERLVRIYSLEAQHTIGDEAAAWLPMRERSLKQGAFLQDDEVRNLA